MTEVMFGTKKYNRYTTLSVQTNSFAQVIVRSCTKSVKIFVLPQLHVMSGPSKQGSVELGDPVPFSQTIAEKTEPLISQNSAEGLSKLSRPERERFLHR